MAFNVFHNPQNVTVGGTAISGVQSVSWSTTQAEITAAGDDDTHVSVARYGTASTRGTITFLDPVSAAGAVGATGDLTFTIKDVKGETDRTVTIADASVGGYDATVARDAASACRLPFIAEAVPVVGTGA